MAKLDEIAERLATSRHRFLTDLQIGALRGRYNATRDEIRTAAIMADRIRRQRQMAEQRPGFAVSNPVEPGAEIVLKDEAIGRRKRRARGAPSSPVGGGRG